MKKMFMKKMSVISLVMVLSVGGGACAPAQEGSQSADAVTEESQRSRGDEADTAAEGTQESRGAGTNRVHKPAGDTGEDRALRELMKARGRYGFSDDASFILTRQTKYAGYTEYIFNQAYSGIPVKTGSFRIDIDDDGDVSRINGKYVDDLPEDLQTSPSVPAGDVIEKNSLGKIDPDSLSLWIIKNTAGDYVLSWKVDRGADENPLYYSADDGTFIMEDYIVMS